MNRAQTDYDLYHIEFEKFIKNISPAIDRELEWHKSFDNFGYYKDLWIQGAWIAWLHCKNIR